MPSYCAFPLLFLGWLSFDACAGCLATRQISLIAERHKAIHFEVNAHYAGLCRAGLFCTATVAAWQNAVQCLCKITSSKIGMDDLPGQT